MTFVVALVTCMSNISQNSTSLSLIHLSNFSFIFSFAFSCKYQRHNYTQGKGIHKNNVHVWCCTPHFHAIQNLRSSICLSWPEEPVKTLSNEPYINMISRLDANKRATEPVFKQLLITLKSMHAIDSLELRLLERKNMTLTFPLLPPNRMVCSNFRVSSDFFLVTL